MARKRRSKRRPSRDQHRIDRGGYSPKTRVNPADVPKDVFRPKRSDELKSGAHS